MITVEFFLSSNLKKIYIKSLFDRDLIDVMHAASATWDALNKVWQIPSTKHRQLLQILDTLEQHPEKYILSVSDDIQKLKDKILKKKQLQEKKNQEIEFIKKNGHTFKFSSLNILKKHLHPFQRTGYFFLEKMDGCAIIADEMGLGKTIQSIAYCTIKSFKTLVVCPASLKFNWLQEIENFTHLRGVILNSATIIDDINSYDFLIVNYEFFISRGNKISKGLEQLLKLTKKNKIKAIILDEAHKIKNEKAKSTKFIHKNFKTIEHRILLSGTPIKSRPIEYFSLLKFIDKERWSSKTEFALRYCGATKTRWGYDYSGASNLEELYFETLPYIIRREKIEVLKDLPLLNSSIKIPIQLTKVEQSKYDIIESGFLETLEDYEDGDNRSNKTNTIDISRMHEMRKYTGNCKIPYIKDVVNTMLEEDETRKIIIFSQYLYLIDELQQYFKETCMTITGKISLTQRNENVIKFQNNPNCRIALLTYAAGGVGLTLTKASVVISAEDPWTPGDKAQAIGRAHRIGQTKEVNTYTFVCKNTIDERVYDLLTLKTKVIDKVLSNKETTTSETISIVRDLVNGYRKDKKKKKNNINA